VNDRAPAERPEESAPPDELGTDDAQPLDAADIEVIVGELVDDEVDVSGESAEEVGAAQTFLADLQRVTADFANFRRQTEKRHADLVKQAGSRLATQLLPVLDAFDAAMVHGSEGVEPIRAQLLLVLEREGLEHIGASSEPFDPNRHEAAMHEPADEGQEQPLVTEVLRTGYAWNGRVLRPAMVKVKG